MSRQTSAAQSAPAGEREAFSREDRYTVIKHKDLSGVPRELLVELRLVLDRLGEFTPERKYVVVEDDWPEYEPVWAMIEARMTTAAPATPAAQGFRDGVASVQGNSAIPNNQDASAAQSAWVPDVSAMARVLSDRSADACNIDRADHWAMYGQEYIDDVQAMLAAAPAHPAERQEQEDLHVWRATTRFGETCHFGEASTARAWAGENGTVERVELTPVPELHVVERQDQGEVQRLREAGDKLYNELRQWLATEHDPESQAALREWRAALAASTGQEVGK